MAIGTPLVRSDGRSEQQPDATLDTANERLLVRRASSDPAAFGELYVRYAPRVFRYLCSKTNASEDAADLTQQVFARALAVIGNYQDRNRPFGAWLFRIAANAAIDFRRRRGRVVPLTVASHVVDPRDDPLERAVISDDLQQLRALVNSLAESDRDLLALRFAGELTSREIAQVVGRSEDAVKKQLWRLLRTLKEGFVENLSD